MKHIHFGLILVAVSIISSSCSKFLDTAPTDTFSPEFYYNTEAQLNTSLIGVYDPLSTDELYGNFILVSLDACTDESFYARNNITTGPRVYNYDFSDVDIRNYWAVLYQGIERANMLIANIQKPKMDENKRQAILGQALFLRGYYHFMLVKDFGDVPLKITPTSSVDQVNYPRSAAKEVYAQVIKDMTEAESMLPSATSIGTGSRVSKTVAQGILARVCLYAAGFPVLDATKYAEALKWASKVVASGEHSLAQTFNPIITNSAYSQIFINHVQDKYDVKESMWEAEFSGNLSDAYLEAGRVGNTNGIQYTPSDNGSDTGYCYGFISATQRLFNLYNSADLRRDWAIAPYNHVAATGARNYFSSTQIYNRNNGKWRRSYETLTPKNKNWTPTNFPLLRYADVLLMLAEAENQVNGPTAIAYDAINMVRRRGYGVPVNIASSVADLPTGLSKQQFQQWIQDERSRELCFEAMRRNDLIRWGIFVTTMNSIGAEIVATAPANFKYAGLGGNNVTSRHLYFPIPAAEMAVNKAMIQNPGW